MARSATAGPPADLELYPSFSAFDGKDGLPLSVVQAITQDSRGYLWAATQDGAAVYNGRSWRSVDMPDQAESNDVHALLATADGAVWFGTGAGVSRWHAGRWQRFGTAHGLPHELVLSLAETREGGRRVVWAGTARGLARWDGRRWTAFSGEVPGGAVRSLLATTAPAGSSLWIGTDQGLARRGTDGSITVFSAGLPAAPVTALLESREGGRSILWAGTDGGGLIRYDGRRWTAVAGPEDARILSLALFPGEKGDELWAGTARGLARRRQGRWSFYNADSSTLPADRVLSLYVSRSGGGPLLWIGMYDGGVAVYRPGGWTTLDPESSGLARPSVYTLAEAGPVDQPAYWLGVDTYGLARWEAGRWTRFGPDSPLGASDIFALLPTGGPARPALWAGTSRGLFRFAAGRWERLDPGLSGLPAATVLSLLETEEPGGRILWVGTRAGLARCPAGDAGLQGRCQVFTPQTSGLPDAEVYALLETRDGDRRTLWAGTRAGGLARWSAGRWEVFQTRGSPLPNNWVNALLATRSGARTFLWVGTDGGLARLDLSDTRPRWLVLNEERGEPRLPGNVVYRIEADARGRIYLATNKGVLRLTPIATDPEGYRLEAFQTHEGLPSDECNQGASMVDRRGRIWVGTLRGVARFDPAMPAQPRKPSPLRLERVLVDGREVPLEGAGGGILRLRPGTREVAFEYALLSFVRGADIRYRTQITGVQDEPSAWTPDSRQSFALQPGDYRILIWGRDAAGVVSGPLETRLEIAPPVWRSGWALLVYAGLSALLFLAAVRLRTGVLERRNRRLGALVHERTQSLAQSEAQSRERASRLADTVRRLEISEAQARQAQEEAVRASRAKSDFLANVSHEIRTPMNAVMGLTGVLLQTELTAEQRDSVETIRSSGEGLLALLNDLLDFAKIEAGRLEIEAVPFSVHQCVEEAVDLLVAEASRKPLALGYQIGDGVPAMVESDATRLRQILVNLLSNAVKFTSAGSVFLSVEAVQDGTGLLDLVFAVRDTGIGIPADRMERLFRPFSQVDPSTTRFYGGTGLGLAITRRLAEGMGGRVWAESEPGRGSVFFVTIRCRVSSFEPPADAAYGIVPLGSEPPVRILLAEDHLVNQKVMRLMLDGMGYAADLACNGREVLEALRLRRYDLVLMDVHMPEMDGLEAARRIREEWPEGEQPRIIAVTADARREDRDACLAAGMDGWLSKPVRAQDLRAAILQTVPPAPRAEGPAVAPPAEAGPVLDPERLDELRRLERPGRPVVRELVDSFVKELPRRLDRIRRAIAGGDGEELTSVAHLLKGSSSMLGAVQVMALARELEQAGRTGILDQAGSLLGELERQTELAKEALLAAAGIDRV